MNYKHIEYIINEYKENFNYDITIDDINDVVDSDENIKKMILCPLVIIYPII